MTSAAKVLHRLGVTRENTRQSRCMKPRSRAQRLTGTIVEIELGFFWPSLGPQRPVIHVPLQMEDSLELTCGLWEGEQEGPSEKLGAGEQSSAGGTCRLMGTSLRSARNKAAATAGRLGQIFLAKSTRRVFNHVRKPLEGFSVDVVIFLKEFHFFFQDRSFQDQNTTLINAEECCSRGPRVQCPWIRRLESNFSNDCRKSPPSFRALNAAL